MRLEYKNRIRTTVLLVLVASLAILTYSYLTGLEKQYREGDQRTFAFFVIREVPEGTSLRDVFNSGFVQRREVLASSLGPGTFESSTQGSEQNLFASRDIPIGQILLLEDFITSQVTTSGLLIPDGNVVVSIRLQDVERISPFLRPGNQVAVYATTGSSQNAKTVTRAIVPKAQILGIGDSRFAGDQGYVPLGDPTILTLAVEAKYAGILIQASKTLSLHFALTPRNTLIASDTVTQAEILGGNP